MITWFYTAWPNSRSHTVLGWRTFSFEDRSQSLWHQWCHARFMQRHSKCHSISFHQSMCERGVFCSLNHFSQTSWTWWFLTVSILRLMVVQDMCQLLLKSLLLIKCVTHCSINPVEGSSIHVWSRLCSFPGTHTCCTCPHTVLQKWLLKPEMTLNVAFLVPSPPRQLLF